uniref:Uncharacterized protein n=1 Tax=Opuntia streptacantha TaxID=393608 RepID=A0A7C9ELA8_OPUST
MNKPPDPYPPTLFTAVYSHLTALPSSLLPTISSFLYRPSIIPTTNHHFLTNCLDFPLLERICVRFWSCRSFLTSVGDLLIFNPFSVGFTIISVPMRSFSELLPRGVIGQLCLQPTTTVVADFRRYTVASSRFYFMTMRGLWKLHTEEEMIQIWPYAGINFGLG